MYSTTPLLLPWNEIVKQLRWTYSNQAVSRFRKALRHVLYRATSLKCGRLREPTERPTKKLPLPHYSITSLARASSVGGTSRTGQASRCALAERAVVLIIAADELFWVCNEPPNGADKRHEVDRFGIELGAA